jgi:hypothetical protein
LSVLRGTPLYRTGYTVLEGDILVSGAVKCTFAKTRALHAMADIKARTWRELRRGGNRKPVQGVYGKEKTDLPDAGRYKNKFLS